MRSGLLEEAIRVLNRGTRHDNRMAAWLGRAACENAVRARLEARGVEVGRAAMRSQLICLEAVDPDSARKAESIWSQLSRACHHHAYDLAPTGAEVAGLLDEVATLARRA